MLKKSSNGHKIEVLEISPVQNGETMALLCTATLKKTLIFSIFPNCTYFQFSNYMWAKRTSKSVSIPLSVGFIAILKTSSNHQFWRHFHRFSDINRNHILGVWAPLTFWFHLPDIQTVICHDFTSLLNCSSALYASKIGQILTFFNEILGFGDIFSL